MTPFENLSFFVWLVIPLIPAVVIGMLGLAGKVRCWWVIITTAFMVYLILRPSLPALIQAICFFIYGSALVRGYLYYRTSSRFANKALVYYLVLISSFLPVTAVKLSSYFHIVSLWQGYVGFLGISYLTFRVAGTIIEIRDGLIKHVALPDFFAFILFFPTLASGPVDRFRRFTDDLYRQLSSREYMHLLGKGLDHIMRGFLYKFIVAYLINKYWLNPLTYHFGVLSTINYMYAYSFYLFFDFAGYSAFAVGTGQILGLDVPQNFNKPFLAENIKDFWGRWHISLSTWFRDYVYMRFVLNSLKKKRFKRKATASALGYLLNFTLMGIWHGLQLQYILYGLYHACLMSVYEFIQRKFPDKENRSYIRKGISILITAQLVMFGFLIFSGRLTQ